MTDRDLTVGEVMRRAAALAGSKRRIVKNQYGTFPVYQRESERVDARRKAAREYQRVLRGGLTTVYCPDCRGPREVQERHARRIEAGEYSGRCQSCRYPNAGLRGDVSWLTAEERLSPRETWARMTPLEQRSLRRAFSMFDLTEIHEEEVAA